MVKCSCNIPGCGDRQGICSSLQDIGGRLSTKPAQPARTVKKPTNGPRAALLTRRDADAFSIKPGATEWMNGNSILTKNAMPLVQPPESDNAQMLKFPAPCRGIYTSLPKHYSKEL